MNSSTKLVPSVEPVAIVGIGCRLPGGIAGPSGLLAFLLAHGDGVVDVPADRWSTDFFYDPNPDAPGKAYVRRGSFLRQNVFDFDPAPFGILAARGGPSRPAAAPAPRGDLGSAGRRVDADRAHPRKQHQRLCGRVHARPPESRLQRAESAPHRRPHGDRRVPHHPLEPPFVHLRPAGPQHHGRHRVLFVARRNAPRVPIGSLRRLRTRDRRWCQRDDFAGNDDRDVQRAFLWLRTDARKRSRRRRTAMAAARAQGSSS